MFTGLYLIGLWYIIVSALAFFLFILIAAIVYWIGTLGIHNLVKRFQMSIPNNRTTVLHVQNLTCFLLLCLIATVAQIYMIMMYSGTDKIVPTDETARYLHKSFVFELTFGIAFIFETLTSLIAGHLILLYSRDSKSDIKQDPITGMEVPSLIFVFS